MDNLLIFYVFYCMVKTWGKFFTLYSVCVKIKLYFASLWRTVVDDFHMCIREPIPQVLEKGN